MVGTEKCMFFGARNLSFWPKNRFLPYNPKFCQRPVCSPLRNGSFPTLESIFRHSLSELWQFSLKKTWPTRQKVSPLPTIGAPFSVYRMLLESFIVSGKNVIQNLHPSFDLVVYAEYAKYTKYAENAEYADYVE